VIRVIASRGFKRDGRALWQHVVLVNWEERHPSGKPLGAKPQEGIMKPFKNILVIPKHPLADDPVLVRAAELALSSGGRITVMWPIEDDEMKELIIAEADEKELASIEDQLNAAVEPLRRKNIPVGTQILTGSSFEDIVVRAFELEPDHDLVMKVARGRHEEESSRFGARALHLMRRCPCPVWIVDPERKASEGNVLAAVDPFIENGEDPLNIMIIELATSVAQMQQGKLHVVHAWTASEEQALRHSPFLRVTPSETMDYVRTIEAQHRQRLDALVARYLDLAPDIEVHLVKGPADEVVPAVAREHNIDVIVMGTHMRTWLNRLVMGSTAEAVVARINCSVLAIKPPQQAET
jgi:nucleotide-binding universal stress UspA family protein